MKHYRATWDHDLPDEPVWTAYEVTDEGRVLRMIEHFAVGWTDYREAAAEDCESLVEPAFDPSAFGGPGATLLEITPDWFAGLWRKRVGS